MKILETRNASLSNDVIKPSFSLILPTISHSALTYIGV